MNRSFLLSLCLLAPGLACKDSRPAPTPPPPVVDTGRADPVTPGAGEADAGLVDAGSATADAGAACSAHGLSTTPAAAQPPLPPAVESMRQRIITAAVACDYPALVALSNERGKGLRFTFGPDEDLATFWRAQEAQGVPILARMVKLLSLPTYNQMEGHYWWPRAHSQNPTDQDYDALRGIFPDAQVEASRRERSYYFLRVGISPEGDWGFAVSGGLSQAAGDEAARWSMRRTSRRSASGRHGLVT